LALISVVIPVFNKAKRLPAVLEALSKQTVPYELVVVDDGSPLSVSREISEAVACFGPTAKGFVYIRSPINKGQSAACNIGAYHSSGDLLFFLDADTILVPEALERLAKAITENKGAFAYCQYRVHGLYELECKSKPFSRADLEKENYISHMSMFHRLTFSKHWFSEDVFRLKDWDLFLRITKNGETGVFVPEVLFETWMEDGDLSTRPDYDKWVSIVKQRNGLQ
jgi:glycosyltransferase involved in cell wall biosynthesis